MSISTTATKITYVGNNSNSTAYPITFKYFDSDHVTVYADGVEISSGGLNYCTFAGDGAAGTGEFTTSLAYAPTVSIVVVLDVPLDQPVVLQETGSLPAKTLEEDGFDRLNMQIRRVWRKVQDVLRFDTTENDASTGTADTLIGFDNAGDIEEVAKSTFLATANDLSDVDAATARTNLNVDISGTDNSTNVTLAGTGTYISIAGQVITVDPITESDIADLGAYITGITGEPLSDLSDVTITSIASGEVLKWNGSAWINQTLAEAGIAAASHNHTASEVTDFDAEVENNTQVAANTSARHDAATKTGTGTYVSLTGQAINVDPIQDGDIDSEAATSDKILKSDGASGAAWGNVEGTEVASTGEAAGSKFLREDGDGTCSWQPITGGGDALTASPLSQFAATTSAQLAGVISDETGSGALVFGTSPSLTTPNLGTPSAIDLTNATNTPLPASDSITYDIIQDVSATDKLLGRSTAGAGTVEEITCSAAGRALLDDVDASAQRTTLGLGTLATQSGTFSGTSSGTNTGDQTITLTGDITGSGTGSFATTIATDAVDIAMLSATGTASDETFLRGDNTWATEVELPSVTGTFTATNSTNNINLTGVGNLTGLAVGDVIEVTGSASNNQLFTVEVITDADNIIVNQAHAGGTTLKSLTGETTASVTVAIHCKAKDAPLGMGQGWMTPTYGTSLQTNSTGRTLVYSVYTSGDISALNVEVDGVQVCAVDAGQANVNSSATVVIPNGSTFQRNVANGQGNQRILR